jgi:hypothetical protein
MNLIIRFCNIHLFRCHDLNYAEQSLEINTYLGNLYSSLDSLKITDNMNKTNLLKNINELLYRFSYDVQDIVLNNIEDDANKQKKISEETIDIYLEDESLLIKNITHYFDNEFKDAKDEIYKFIDE